MKISLLRNLARRAGPPPVSPTGAPVGDPSTKGDQSKPPSPYPGTIGTAARWGPGTHVYVCKLNS